MPGTFTRESPQNPGLAVNIRGFEGSGRVNMMIDGVRQNFRFTGHEAQGFVYVDPSLLAGVDIARGAVSTAGGAGALVGAANLRTLDVDDIIKPGNKTGVMSSIELRHQWRGLVARCWRPDASGRQRRRGRRDQPSRAGQLQERRRPDGSLYTQQDLVSGLVQDGLQRCRPSKA